MSNRAISLRSASGPRPASGAVGCGRRYRKGEVQAIPVDRHTRLLCAVSGLLSVSTTDQLHAVSASRALCIGPEIACRITCRSDAEGYVLRLAPDMFPEAGRGCRVVRVTDLVRALVLELGEGGCPVAERRDLMLRLLLAELRRSACAAAPLALPRNPRLAAACRHVADNLMEDTSLDALADIACMSRRTFTRLFRQETGLSLGEWRQHLRLLESMAMLDAGRSVTTVAQDIGYSSASAFSTAFRRAFGVLPSRYRQGSRLPEQVFSPVHR